MSRRGIHLPAVQLAGGHAWPTFEPGSGWAHRLRARARLDPVVARAEGVRTLSLYLGHRSRVTGDLGPESRIVVDPVQLGSQRS